MPLFRQIAMRPGAYETAVGRQLYLSPNDLARCRDETLRLLARGWRVPVFVGHVEYASGEGGPRREAPRDSPRWLGRAPSSTAVGQLVDVTLEPDGSLAHVIFVKRRYITDLRQGRLRHTSPEIRPAFTAAPGETLGPVIAHIALTRRPLCRGQTRLALVPREEATRYCLQNFSHLQAKGNDMEPQQQTPLPVDDTASTAPLTTPDAPPPQQPETDGLGNPSSDESRVDRVTLAERIRRSRKLPRGLRERLCELVETLQLSADAPSEPVVPVAEAVAMIEAAVPEHLALTDDELEQPPHPRGEDFFRPHGAAMTDDEADRIAREQLAASGFGAQA